MQQCFCGHYVEHILGYNLMFKMMLQIVTTANLYHFILETSLSHDPDNWI